MEVKWVLRVLKHTQALIKLANDAIGNFKINFTTYSADIEGKTENRI